VHGPDKFLLFLRIEDELAVNGEGNAMVVEAMG
jgi:hypothetical protein